MNPNHYASVYRANYFLQKHSSSVENGINQSLYFADDKHLIFINSNGDIKKGKYYPIYNQFKEEMLNNTFAYRGVKGYIGIVSLLDNEIEDIIPIDKIFNKYCHHRMFLSRGQFDRVENGESSLFVVIDKKVFPYYDFKIPQSTIKEIEKKITFL